MSQDQTSVMHPDGAQPVTQPDPEVAPRANVQQASWKASRTRSVAARPSRMPRMSRSPCCGEKTNGCRPSWSKLSSSLQPKKNLRRL